MKRLSSVLALLSAASATAVSESDVTQTRLQSFQQSILCTITMVSSTTNPGSRQLQITASPPLLVATTRRSTAQAGGRP